MTQWRELGAPRVRWYEFAPELVVLGGLGIFAISEPHAARSGLNSTKAVVLIAVVAIAWISARAFMFATVRRRLLRAGPFVVGALAVLKVVVLPAYDNHTVIEASPLAAATPMNVRTAMLTGIDHRANGTVNVYRRASGEFVVGLESFDIQPGPAYALYVVPGSERRDHDGGTRLAALRGNRGTQFYEVPAASTFGDGAWTVLVWCETFDVPVAHATPT